MSFSDLIEQANAKNKELTPITIRVPAAIRNWVEDFSDGSGISKQDVMLEILVLGMEQARKELEVKPAPSSNAKYHILNTNKAHTDYDHDMMLDDGIAAAFYSPWKLNIDRIKSDDWVFLYENQRGIVAFGKGTGVVLKRDHEGATDECHFQELSNFTVLAVPVTAAEIKKVLGRNQVFLRTMTGVPDGQKLLKEVQSRAAVKRG